MRCGGYWDAKRMAVHMERGRPIVVRSLRNCHVPRYLRVFGRLALVAVPTGRMDKVRNRGRRMTCEGRMQVNVTQDH